MPISISPLSEDEALAEQFDDLKQQRSADHLGMWVFLATEVLFFGGLFMCYTVNRWLYPDAFIAASHHTKVILGGANTAILIFSGTLMALAVRAAELKNRKQLIWLLLGTAALGLIFLGVKGYEYHVDYLEGDLPGRHFQWHEANPGQAELFFWLYYAMTGLHAIHLAIGIIVMLTLAVLVWLGKFTRGHYMPVAIAGLYWGFVDMIWIFLFPLIYLAGHR